MFILTKTFRQIKLTFHQIMDSGYIFGNADSYDTPENNRASLWFRLLLGSRIYFYWHVFGVFCKTGMLGAAGKLDKTAQIRYSTMNVRTVERCGARFHVRGLENLRQVSGEPVVIVSNHMSLLETGLFHALIREYLDFSFVIKKSLLKVPFFKDILLSLKAIAITRTNPREDLKTVLEEGKRILAEGRSIIVFPQGTRSRDFDREKFSSIGVKLAAASGVKILPCALKTDFLGNGKHLRDLGPIFPERDVWFEFGEPLTIAGRGREELEKSADFIESHLKEWKRLEGAGGEK